MTGTQLILLGTAGGPTPKSERNAPAQAVVVDGHTYVVDYGNGVAGQLVRAGVALDTLTAMFLTHHHSDHNADHGTLPLLAWASNLTTEVATVGPPPLARMTERFLDAQSLDIETRIKDEGRPPLAPLLRACEVTRGGVVFEDKRVRVTAALVAHPPLEVALAYRFDTADRSIVISGDTAPTPALVELARGADVLVHECIHLPSIDAMLGKDPHAARLREHLEDSHTSIDLVGGIAEEAGVGTLVLSHLVPADGGIDDQTWHELGSRGFSGTTVVGHDLLVL